MLSCNFLILFVCFCNLENFETADFVNKSNFAASKTRVSRANLKLAPEQRENDFNNLSQSKKLTLEKRGLLRFYRTQVYY